MNRSLRVVVGCVAGAIVFGAAWGSLAAGAAITLPGVFSDHMVLQRDMDVPVWGQSAPGEKVTVQFRNQAKAITAGADGKWMVRLSRLKAGGPDTLVVKGASGTNAIMVQDVWVGEVWVGSGQSNMQMPVANYVNGDEALAAAVAQAPYPRLRLLAIGSNARWQEATSNNVNHFSALLFSFGLRVYQELDVPVGLMVGAVGGTPSGRWLSDEALRADASCQPLIAKYAATYDQLQTNYAVKVAQWETNSAAAKQQGTALPARPAPPARPGEVTPGKCGDLYEAYIRPAIPYGIRGVLWDQGESGTDVGGVDQYTLMGALIRGWRKDWGQGDFPFIYVEKPSGGGCAWDPTNAVNCKGEAFEPLPASVPGDGSYVGLHIKIMQYPTTAMAISSDLGPGTHPVNKFGYGHRAGDVALGIVYGRTIEYYGPVFETCRIEGNKVRVRFTHVGQGLAFAHGEKLQGFAVAGADKVFQWADATVVAPKFPWQRADTIVIASAKVPQPVAVRYAWSSNRRWANLFNKDGLPALPFRTDEW